MPNKLNTEEFIKRSNKSHNNFYNYSKSKYIGSGEKVIIICPIHKEFSQKAHDHMLGIGCAKCGSQKSANSKKFSFEDFIKKAKFVHNSKYDYSQSNYVDYSTKINIKCEKNHYFMQKPNSHLNGHGCPVCKNNKKLTSKEYIEKAKLIHGDKYNYSDLIYVNASTKLTIICKNNHKFKMRPHDHLNGFGCAICSGNKKTTTKGFIQKAKLVHNNKYDYKLVKYKNNGTKIKIKCKKHGLFKQTPNSHLNGHGCPNCFSFSSKKENAWLDSLKIDNLIRTKHFKHGKQRFIFDGFDPLTNTIYEFNGDFWHGNPKIYKAEDTNYFLEKTFGELYEKTLKKESYLKALGFNLVTMWECDWDEICKVGLYEAA